MKISVITICYNAENDIERTIRSVLSQTFLDMEYIIVDGDSKDNTVNIAQKIIKEFPHHQVHLISEPDNGIYDAMNKGIKLAKGEWINMMNAGDCFADQNVLQNIFGKKIPNNISFLYSDLYKKTNSGKYFRVNMYCSEHKKCLVHQSTIYKRTLHEQYGYYIVTPKIIISDYLFFLQIPINQMMKTDTVIAKYEGNGISEKGTWCKKQILCANIVYRHSSFWSLYFHYLKWRIRTFIPRKIREKIRIYLSEVK